MFNRRQHLQGQIKSMQSKYIEMKQECLTNRREIINLRNENATLLDHWQKELKEKEEDEDEIIESYK